ncbi:MAG: TM2 domain-containing protein [Bacteroidota bacterium]
MKQILTIAFLALISFQVSATNEVKNAGTQVAAKVMASGLPAQIGQMTTEEFLSLTPSQVKKMTGERMKLKEVFALKAAQKEIKKELGRDGKGGAAKSQLIALLLVIFLGELGIHRFYLGYTTYGIIQLLTLGGCGIWALIDLIRIITGDLKPADGSNYNPTL